jgi:hypothetical protein
MIPSRASDTRRDSSPDARSFSNLLGGSIIVAASSKTALKGVRQSFAFVVCRLMLEGVASFAELSSN